MIDETEGMTETETVEAETAGAGGDTGAGQPGAAGTSGVPAAAAWHRLKLDTKPEDLPDEYWDAKTGEVRVESVVKRAEDLRRQVSELGKKSAAPEDGYALPEDERLAAIGIAADDPAVQQFNELGKEINLTQPQYEAVLKWVAAAAKTPDEVREASRSAAEEHVKQALGEVKGAAVVAANEQWLSTFADDEAAALREALHVPGVHQALAALRRRADGPGGLRQGDTTETPPPTEASLRALIAEPDYWQNPEKQKAVRDGYRQLFPETAA